MTLNNVILFPQAMLPLYIFEPRYRKMLAEVLAGNRLMAVALRREDRNRETPAGVAGLGLVRACVTRRDGTANLILQGVARIKLGKVVQYRPYRRHKAEPLPLAGDTSLVVQALTAKVLELVEDRLQHGVEVAAHQIDTDNGKAREHGAPFTVEAFHQALKQLAHLDDAEQLTDLVSATLLRDARQRQTILETTSLEDRLRHLVHFLQAGAETEDPAHE